MNIKNFLGKLFVYKYDENEDASYLMLVTAIIGIIWGVISLSLNFNYPIPIPASFRYEHPVMIAWMFLPTKISAYIIVMLFDIFRFVFMRTPQIVNDAYVMVSLVLLSTIIGSKITTAIVKKILALPKIG